MLPQPRHRAQANLETEIVAAEAQRIKWAYVVDLLTAAGRPARHEEAMVRLATQKLAQLRESRAVLASGESGNWQS